MAARTLEELQKQYGKAAGDELAEKIRTSGKNVSIRRLDVGPVIGAHSGPGTVGCIFIKA